jgi:hypothetical protein
LADVRNSSGLIISLAPLKREISILDTPKEKKRLAKRERISAGLFEAVKKLDARGRLLRAR